MVRWAPGEVVAPQPRTSGASVFARLRTAPPQRAVLIALWVATVVFEALALRPVMFDRELPV
jgi:hypothetical protein